jgi:hypothetical protein
LIDVRGALRATVYIWRSGAAPAIPPADIETRPLLLRSMPADIETRPLTLSTDGGAKRPV